MLRQRLLTAAVLIPAVLLMVWLAPLAWLYALFVLVGALAAAEWSRLAGMSPNGGVRAAYVTCSVVVMVVLWFLRGWWPWFAMAAVIWWLGALSLIVRYPAWTRGRRPSPWLLALLGQLLWPPAILALAMLRAQPFGAEKLFFALGLVWAADTGAYFVGRRYGRHKLAPLVSPGKTVEGAAGGLLLALVWTILAGFVVFRLNGGSLFAALCAVGVVVAAASIVGDLSLSMFKRLSGLKDSGHLLPGHGGVLDRVDSLLAAAPVLALGLLLLGLWSRV